MSIDHAYLDELWASISESENTALSFKRIDISCTPELSIGLTTAGNRCLVLELPNNNSIDFQAVLRKNLNLELHMNSIIVLELKAPDFNEIFSDLVISLYWSIHDISSVESYASIFIETFHKWSDFFSERDLGRLSEESIRGLFGELTVLKGYLEEAKSSEVNQYLMSWKGPYGKGKDFELDALDIEVKTRNLTNLSVRVSSEHQLDRVLGKELQLWVIALQSGESGDTPISELMLDIKKMVVDKLGDLSIFLKALWQLGITMENSLDYDMYKYCIRLISKYDASDADFPSLTKSTIHQALTRVRYDLGLVLLEDFLIEEISF